MLKESFFLCLLNFSMYTINYEQNFVYFQSIFLFFPNVRTEKERAKEREG